MVGSLWFMAKLSVGRGRRCLLIHGNVVSAHDTSVTPEAE